MKSVKVILAGLLAIALFTPATVPGQPLVTPPSVTLAWSPSPDVTVSGYNLYYGEVASNWTNRLDVGPALTATVTNLQSGATYFFFATAYDASAIESEPSNLINYTPPAASYPDLVVSSVNVLPASPVAGNQVRFSAVVANQGAAAIPAGLGVRVSFSVNGASAVAWAYLTNGLLPGASAVVAGEESAGFGTWTAVAGVHTVTATADDLGALAESAETNNQFQVALSVGPAPLPVVSIAVNRTTIPEGDASGVLVTIARAGDDSEDLPVALTVAGSAVSGVDYVPLSGTIVIPAGNLAASFPLIPLRNGIVDAGRTVSLGLAPNANYQIQSPGTAGILIANDESVPPGNLSTQSVTLAWSASPDSSVVGYNLYHGEVSGTLTNKLNVGPALSATVSNLSVGVTYFFFATAYDGAGVESEPSNFITHTPTIPVAGSDRDSDGDGLSDAAEALAGTDANDPESNLRIVSLRPEPTGQMTITWASVPGITYRVMFRNSLTESGWNPASPPITATGNVTSLAIPATNAAAYFSLSVSPNPGG